MHEFLVALRELAPAATVAVLSAMATLGAGCAAYAAFLLWIVPRIETRDPGGWAFAGALTLSVAFLIFEAAIGQGKAYEVLKDAPVALGICLGTVVTALLGYHSIKVRAENQPPLAPNVPTTVTTTTTTADPAPVAPAAAVTVTETKTP